MPRKPKLKSDVPHCEFHTRDDQHGNEVRIGPCNGYCRIAVELKQGFPLDVFNRKIDSYTDAELLKANPKKAAKLYGIKEEHAAGYLRMEQERRGLHIGA